MVKILFSFKVKEVRTLDDTVITVKLMVNYELNDIEKMVSLRDLIGLNLIWFKNLKVVW